MNTEPDPYIWKEIPTYGDRIPLDEFFKNIEFFTDDDGSGYLATQSCMSDIDVYPLTREEIPSGFTQVIWFNK